MLQDCELSKTSRVFWEIPRGLGSGQAGAYARQCSNQVSAANICNCLNTHPRDRTRTRQLVKIHCGRAVSPDDIETIRSSLSQDPALTRTVLQHKLCVLWQWLKPNEKLKEMTEYWWHWHDCSVIA